MLLKLMSKKHHTHVFEAVDGTKKDQCKYCGITRLVPRRPNAPDPSLVCCGAYKDHAWIDSDLFPGKVTCVRCGDMNSLLPIGLLVDLSASMDSRTTAEQIGAHLDAAKAIAEESKK